MSSSAASPASLPSASVGSIAPVGTARRHFTELSLSVDGIGLHGDSDSEAESEDGDAADGEVAGVDDMPQGPRGT